MAGSAIGFMVLMSGLVLAIAYIDIKTYRIPDPLNLGLFLSGACYSYFSVDLSLIVQLTSASIVILALLCVRLFYSKLRGQVGLGLGDVKMAGAAAVWINPFNMPFLLMFASGSAVVLLILQSVFWGRELNRSSFVPFGPFIGGALMIVWILQVSGTL